MPLFEGDHPVDRGSSDRASNRSDETTENDSGDNASDDDTSIDLRNDTLLEHLSFEQISILKRSRKRVVKFQLSWYEIMPNEEAENRQHCGRLYRGDRKRSIQLQSFMVSEWISRYHFDGFRTDRPGNGNLAGSGRRFYRRFQVLNAHYHGACHFLLPQWGSRFI
jgi:hypothetical protein